MLPEDMIAEAMEKSNPIEEVFALVEAGDVDMRDVGGFIADNADNSWLHPWLSEGFAYIDMGNNVALAASWDDQGFWEVWETTVKEAEEEIAERETLDAEGEEE